MSGQQQRRRMSTMDLRRSNRSKIFSMENITPPPFKTPSTPSINGGESVASAATASGGGSSGKGRNSVASTPMREKGNNNRKLFLSAPKNSDGILSFLVKNPTAAPSKTNSRSNTPTIPTISSTTPKSSKAGGTPSSSSTVKPPTTPNKGATPSVTPTSKKTPNLVTRFIDDNEDIAIIDHEGGEDVEIISNTSDSPPADPHPHVPTASAAAATTEQKNKKFKTIFNEDGIGMVVEDNDEVEGMEVDPQPTSFDDAASIERRNQMDDFIDAPSAPFENDATTKTGERHTELDDNVMLVEDENAPSILNNDEPVVDVVVNNQKQGKDNDFDSDDGITYFGFDDDTSPSSSSANNVQPIVADAAISAGNQDATLHNNNNALNAAREEKNKNMRIEEIDDGITLITEDNGSQETETSNSGDGNDGDHHPDRDSGVESMDIDSPNEPPRPSSTATTIRIGGDGGGRESVISTSTTIFNSSSFAAPSSSAIRISGDGRESVVSTASNNSSTTTNNQNAAGFERKNVRENRYELDDGIEVIEEVDENAPVADQVVDVEFNSPQELPPTPQPEFIEYQPNQYEFGWAKNGQPKKHIFVFELPNDRSKIREYFNRDNKWNCVNCYQVDRKTILRGTLNGKVFEAPAPTSHICSLASYAEAMEKQAQIKGKEHDNNDETHGGASSSIGARPKRNSSLIGKEAAEATKQQKESNSSTPNTFDPEYLSRLRTRKVKFGDYYYGLNERGKEKERIIVYEENDRNLVREYSITSVKWYCCKCYNINTRRVYAYLKEDGIFEIPKVHLCKPITLADSIKNQKEILEYRRKRSPDYSTAANASDTSPRVARINVPLTPVENNVSDSSTRRNSLRSSLGHDSSFQAPQLPPSSTNRVFNNSISSNFSISNQTTEIEKPQPPPGFRDVKSQTFREWGSDSNGEIRKLLIVKEEEDRTKVREYTKENNDDGEEEWVCLRCDEGSKAKAIVDKEKKIFFVPIQHSCDPIPLAESNQIQSLNKTRRNPLLSNSSSSHNKSSSLSSSIINETRTTTTKTVNNRNSISITEIDDDRASNPRSSVSSTDSNYRHLMDNSNNSNNTSSLTPTFRQVPQDQWKKGYNAIGDYGKFIIVTEEDKETHARIYRMNYYKKLECNGCKVNAKLENDQILSVPINHERNCKPKPIIEIEKNQEKYRYKGANNKRKNSDDDESPSNFKRAKSAAPTGRTFGSRTRTESRNNSRVETPINNNNDDYDFNVDEPRPRPTPMHVDEPAPTFPIFQQPAPIQKLSEPIRTAPQSRPVPQSMPAQSQNTAPSMQQFEYGIPLKAEVEWFHPSGADLKKICIKLGLGYSINIQQYWMSTINIEKILPTSRPNNVRQIQSTAYPDYGCLSYFFAANEENCFQIKDALHYHLLYNYQSLGTCLGHDFTKYFYTDPFMKETLISKSLTEIHIVMMAKWLEIRFAIFNNNAWKLYGNWQNSDTPSNIPTLILEYKNGKYQPVLSLTN